MGAPLVSLLVFLFCLLSTISTTTANPPIPKHSKSSTNFILASCRATSYPALCYQTLSGYANKIQRSERQLAVTALAVSLARARSAAQFVSKLSKARGIKHREYAAIKDCINTMGNSVDQLSRSIKEIGHMRRINGQDFEWHMSNVQTWVSAALTNENTCVDGFSEHAMNGKMKAAIRMRVTNVAQVTSNALALVNRFAARHRIGKDVESP